jgi:hypothetical protein
MRPIKPLEGKDHLISNRLHEFLEPRPCEGAVRVVRLIDWLPDEVYDDSKLLRRFRAFRQ